MSASRLAQGLEVVAVPDGIAVVNGGHPVLFHGRAASEVLVPLLGALDGTRDAAALANELSMQLAHVERGLALLDERGLLDTVD